MSLPLNRRQVLGGLAAAPLLGHSRTATAAPSGVFAHGVASGDPEADSVILWTRVSIPAARVAVRWELAEDADFLGIAAAGEVATGPDRDHTVKVIADGLEPGRRYHYRFEAGGERSPTGTTRTLPLGPLESLGIALASCSNFPFGHFNAYAAIAEDTEIEFVLHLGDYIYEYGPDGYGGRVGAGLGRAHVPAYEIVTLADYRRRHAQYKADAGSRAMHAAHPLIPIWDDHESANNPWMGGAENHQPDAEGDWAARRAASLQAYYEWMPVRDPAPGRSRADYWRHFAFGDLASLVTLETRHTGRSRQIEYDDHPAALASVEAAEAFRRDVLEAPGRTMLAPEQEDFVVASLAESVRAGRPWRLIGNQIPMARVHVPPLDGALASVASDPADPVSAHRSRLAALGRVDLPIYLDTWDGYPAARERLYARCRAAGATDLLVLTGDSHSFWTNALRDGGGRPVGLEVGTAGITSPGDFEAFGSEAAARMDELIARHNPEVLWTDNRHRGYVRLVLTRAAARVDVVTVDRIDVPGYRTRLLRREQIVRRDGVLEFTG